MLENLMKRNLVLEAQVAELRVEKIHPAPSMSSVSVPGLPTPSFSAAMSSPPSEPRPGSWEKAFRTPLEAGPPMPKIRKSGVSDAPFQNETGLPPPRIETKPTRSSQAAPPLVISERTGSFVSGPAADNKFSERPTVVSSASAWEDSPKYVGESTGVLTPSVVPRKIAQIVPDSGLKQPYIPVPAPRMLPPSVIVGPMNQKPSSPGRQAPRPIVRPTFPSKSSIKEQLPGSETLESMSASAPIIIDKPEGSSADLKPSGSTSPIVPLAEEKKEKGAEKPPEGYKKKPSKEED
jgi:hypothetical protein